MKKNSLFPIFIGISLLLLILVGVTWVNYKYSSENPGGTDFLVHWEGSRAFIFEGISPYSDVVALRIQNAIYGRPAKKGEHEFRVAYPFYSEAMFLPFALISDYTWARAIWMTFLEIVLLVITIVCLQLTNWKPSLKILVSLFLFSLLWYHAMRSLINGNAVVVALLIVTSLLAIRDKHDEVAGILLACSTIKPHVVVLFILFVLLWAVSKRRWKIIIWTVGFELVLVGGGMLFLPNWVLQNIWEILRYRSYNPPGTIFDVFREWFPGIGFQLAVLLSGILAVILIYEWIQALGKNDAWFLWTASLTLVISQWIGIQTDPGNFIILVLPLILVLTVVNERWSRIGEFVVLGVLLCLFLGLWGLFLKTVSYGVQPQQSPIMFFPLPLFLLLGLYWVRWWVTRRAHFSTTLI